METKIKVEGSSAPNESGSVAIGKSAASLATEHGGLREGRARADGLVPGSPEAIEADREKARIRKAKYREKLKATEPPPALPAAIPAVATTTPSQAVNTGAVCNPPGDSGAFVPWTANDVSEVSSRILGVIEEWSVNKLTEKAIQAKLAPEDVKMVEKDAHWGAGPKDQLNKSIANMGSQKLNEMGVSAKNKDLTFGIASLISIGYGYVRLTNRMNQLIAQQQASEPPKK